MQNSVRVIRWQRPGANLTDEYTLTARRSASNKEEKTMRFSHLQSSKMYISAPVSYGVDVKETRSLALVNQLSAQKQ